MEKSKRLCLRCGAEMLENGFVTIPGRPGLYGHFAVKQDTGKLFAAEVGEPSFAVCPECGEISWYLDPASLKDLTD